MAVFGKTRSSLATLLLALAGGCGDEASAPFDPPTGSNKPVRSCSYELSNAVVANGQCAPPIATYGALTDTTVITIPFPPDPTVLMARFEFKGVPEAGVYTNNDARVRGSVTARNETTSWTATTVIPPTGNWRLTLTTVLSESNTPGGASFVVTGGLVSTLTRNSLGQTLVVSATFR